MGKVILIFVAILTTGLGEPAWETLRVTWGIPGQTTNAFDKMPLTAETAKSEGFTKISDKCSGTFKGNRYIKGNDTAVILLYDVNGHIAGIQTALPKTLLQPINSDYPYNSSVVYQEDTINGQDVYVLTAYFVDPEIICTKGRSDSDVQKEGTARDLYLRNGTSLVKIPKKQGHIANTDWKKGGCFESMGQHYWYNMYEELRCEEFLPVFLMYNRGKLTGFGFANVGKFTFSNRYEYPPKFVLQNFIVPVPNCLPLLYDRVGGYTTLHIYFNVRPENLKC